MIDIVQRLRFDAVRCEATFSKGVASNIEEGAAEIERQQKQIASAVKAIEFAGGLAWDAERLIPETDGRRLKAVLNNIRQGYLKPALAMLSHQQQPRKENP